ncbi:MAG: histidine kinase [Acidimicrobiales bacterium]
MMTSAAASVGTRLPRARGLARSTGRGFELFGLAVAGWAIVVTVVAAGGYAGTYWLRYAQHNGLAQGVALAVGLAIVAVFGLPRALLAVRRLASLTRRLSGEWCGVVIAEPYPPAVAGEGKPGSWSWWLRALGQVPTWRDLAWTLLAPGAAWSLLVPVAAPAALAVYGLASPGQENAPVLVGLAVITVGTSLSGPWLLRAYCLLARSLLGPTAQARVRHLAETRSESLDAGAAELRRIERDLHDGAQARLVALGMALGALQEVLGKDEEAARALVFEAQASSSKALAELRDLVRGIHPPVLADRGLADAVRALALDHPLPVEVVSDLAGRPPAPVESAVYFAVSELLANVSKHSGAARAWVELRHRAGGLHARVGDDGCGGADPSRGTGLHGIERRLAAFDGRMRVDSRPGGPTVVELGVPCELSSPKTSSS